MASARADAALRRSLPGSTCAAIRAGRTFVSDTICFHHHARRGLDAAIRAGFLSLSDDHAARAVYARLLALARERSTLLRPAGCPELRAGAALVLRNLARHHGEYLAPIETWAGGDGSVQELVHALAQHLLARYPVPRLLASVWFEDDEADGGEAQRWFVAHAAGQRFRDIEGLPLQLTRRMEHILLTSPPHLPLRAAMRRAELLGLDAPAGAGRHGAADGPRGRPDGG
jgi:hypothetical protein